ncbi:MAG: hypothetical protein WKF36_05580 [Candidatus Nitrosocosmicus sp.]
MPYSVMKTTDKPNDSLDTMRSNLIDYYTNILKTIVYLNSISQSGGAIVESISNLYEKIIKDSQEVTEEGPIASIANAQSSCNPQSILSILNYLKFTGFIDYYVDNMKKDKITITISPVISAFLLQVLF